MTLSATQKNNLICLYEASQSLRCVSRETGHSVNTVKKYVLLRRNICSQKSIVRSVASNDDLLLGVYVGLWMGDGTQYYDTSKKSYVVKICVDSRNMQMNAFIMGVFQKLFSKESSLQKVRRRGHSATICVHSKFIYQFIQQYCEWEKIKTHSVRLKLNVSCYSDSFCQGCFLGLMLSDGYAKDRLIFNVTSLYLAKNFFSLLRCWGWHPKYSTIDRSSHGWKTLHRVSLSSEESRQALCFLDNSLRNLGSTLNFKEIKGYEPARI